MNQMSKPLEAVVRYAIIAAAAREFSFPTLWLALRSLGLNAGQPLAWSGSR